MLKAPSKGATGPGISIPGRINWYGTRNNGTDHILRARSHRLCPITDILSSPAAEKAAAPQLVLPSINAEPGYSPEELKLAEKPSNWLVDELMAAAPCLTMRRSLMRLRRPKLARMLLRAWAAADAARLERRQA